MNTVASLPRRRGVRWVLAALGLLLAACAVHALAGFDAGPLSWLLEKWGYNVVLVGSGFLCLARGVTVRDELAARSQHPRRGRPERGDATRPRSRSGAR